MGTDVESLPPGAQGVSSSSIRRPFVLQSGGCELRVEPDGALRSLYSLEEGRALFGFEQLSFYKVHAGIVVPAQKPDWALRLSPRGAQLTGRVFDGIEAAQSLGFHHGGSPGFVRRLRVRNGTRSPVRLRIVEVADPTAAHFGSSGAWGSIGVNAFNRESHVAMDEVSDPPSARVVGAAPPPSKFYMTASESRAVELVSLGELPDATAGMSGQVVVIGSHELELAAGESREITWASIYTPGKLEEALSEFGRLQSGEGTQNGRSPFVACSERQITEAAAWCIPAIEAGAHARDPLDRYEALPALAATDPSSALKVVEEAGAALRREGWLPHSLDPSKPGLLETAVFLKAAAELLLAAQDKKLARARYPLIKKIARYLLSSSKDFAVVTDPSLPQGWRRKLGRGYPTGEVPEVSLAVAGALTAASQLSRYLSKPDEASRFRERSEMVADRVRKKLVDERGFLVLCRDSSGRLKGDETVDMAAAAYRHQLMPSAEQAVAHRLLDKDFDTPFGPRCVPTTNQLYFNSSYGAGQLGGVWTRATLAHALVCYRAGLAGLGSLALGKVARLVMDESAHLGGYPGEFPRWVDVEGRAAHGDQSDPVAAARFLEAILKGELGLSTQAEGASLSPAMSSGLQWLMACDLCAGESFSAFLGRSAGGNHLFIGGGRVASKGGAGYGKSERVDVPAREVFGVTFHSPGQIICLGSSASSSTRFTVSFSPRAADLTRRLSTPLEEYDPSTRVWNKTGSLRVSPAMSFEASLAPSGWKAYRISSA